MSFDEMLAYIRDRYPVVAIPEDICAMCMKHEEEVGELIICQIMYSYRYSQKRLCNACREKVSVAVTQALKDIGWD